ncbi:MAG: dTDP-4-dehydrorhamnose reductase [Polyangiaceae bacterium]|nr:dTDP-4-dehydrorhamnose reductase [Polyangiaceae bacterium]
MNEAERPLILLTGKNGQLGFRLQRALAPLGRVVAQDRSELDLSVPSMIRQRVAEIKPDLIVNAAAYTAVDRAESEPELARAVNATAPEILATECKRGNIPLLHYSTDYVFDGKQSRAYTEEQPAAPVTQYGQSKLEGEQAVQASGAKHIILRLSWVFDTRGSNFLRTMLRLGKEREQLSVVSDQHGAPTWSREVADASATIAKTMLAPTRPASELLHMPAAGSTTWFEYATRIFELAEGDAWPRVEAISTADYPTPAKRPAYSILSGNKLQEQFGIRLPSWDEQLRGALAEIGNS